MAEYINKTELINYLDEKMLWTKRGWEDMISVIDELPTIDIVVCEECEYCNVIETEA